MYLPVHPRAGSNYGPQRVYHVHQLPRARTSCIENVLRVLIHALEPDFAYENKYVIFLVRDVMFHSTPLRPPQIDVCVQVAHVGERVVDGESGRDGVDVGGIEWNVHAGEYSMHGYNM